jgi:hypothetical protein
MKSFENWHRSTNGKDNGLSLLQSIIPAKRERQGLRSAAAQKLSRATPPTAQQHSRTRGDNYQIHRYKGLYAF